MPVPLNCGDPLCVGMLASASETVEALDNTPAINMVTKYIQWRCTIVSGSLHKSNLNSVNENHGFFIGWDFLMTIQEELWRARLCLYGFIFKILHTFPWDMQTPRSSPIGLRSVFKIKCSSHSRQVLLSFCTAARARRTVDLQRWIKNLCIVSFDSTIGKPRTERSLEFIRIYGYYFFRPKLIFATAKAK